VDARVDPSLTLLAVKSGTLVLVGDVGDNCSGSRNLSFLVPQSVGALHLDFLGSIIDSFTLLSTLIETVLITIGEPTEGRPGAEYVGASLLKIESIRERSELSFG